MAHQMEMSKTYQYRKVMKPLLERKRRARINKCLDELKNLMIECLTQEGEHITRLEKADILELTVDHLRKIRNRKEQLASESFRNGYIQAANEMSRALSSAQGVDIALGTQLMAHLGHRLNSIQSTSLSIPTIPNSPSSLVPESENLYTSPGSPASSGYDSESEIIDPSSDMPSKTLETVKEDMWRPW